MAPERVTVTIRSSFGEDAPLTVQDATRQLLDFFELLSAAGGEGGDVISWRLVSVSLESPLTATAEAFSTAPDVPPEPIARIEKAQLASTLRGIMEGHTPDWMGSATLARARRFFERNLNGIGRTDVKFDDETPLVIIAERGARVAVSVLAKTEQPRELPAHGEDLSRSEIGSVEGDIIELTTYYGQPAIRLRERLHGWDIPCVLSTTLAERIGHDHDWLEVWGGRRVQVSGEIIFGLDGRIRRVNAMNIQSVHSRPVSFSDIADPNFTGGLPIREYLRHLWDDEVG